MELKTDIEVITCPACQGLKKIEWNHTEYPCLVCEGNGTIELKPQAIANSVT